MVKKDSILGNVNSLKEFVYLLNNFQDYKQFKENELKFYFLLYKNNEYGFEKISNYAKSLAGINTLNIEKIDEEKNIQLFKIRLSKILQRKEEVCEALFLFDEQQKSLMVCSDFPAKMISVILESFIRSLYPFVQRMAISSNEIEEIIDSLEKEGYKVTSSMLAKKRWWEKVRRSGVEYPSSVPIVNARKDSLELEIGELILFSDAEYVSRTLLLKK